MKKRGFGAGKWNGFGGKVENNENVLNAAIRELQEEIGVITESRFVDKVGHIIFKSPDPTLNWDMHVFFARKWEGEPQESEEMKPRWYRHQEIPLDFMWPDDKLWLPLVLSGKKVEGEFYFNADGSGFDTVKLREVKP